MQPQLWRSFVAVAQKEFVHATRNKMAIRQVIVMQVVQLLMLGFIDTTVKDLPMVVVDQDRSSESRALIAKVEATGTFDLKFTTNSLQQARDLVRQGRASAGLVIPPEYHRQLASGERASTLLLVDGSDPSSSSQANATMMGLAAEINFEKSTVDADVNHVAKVDPHTLFLYNPQGRTANYMLPSLLAIMVAAAFVHLSSGALIRERDRGTLERLLMTPINLTGLMLGKLIPYFIIGVLNVFGYVAIMRWGFNVPINGNIGVLALALVLYVATILSLGTFLASSAATHAEVTGKAVLFTIPNLFLSGYVWPLTSVPTFLLPISYLLPATHMVQLMRGIVLRGAGFVDLLPSFLYMMLAPALLTVLGVRRFAKTLEN